MHRPSHPPSLPAPVVVFVGLIAALASCKDLSAPEADDRAVVSRDIVTPAIAEQLDNAGRFPASLPSADEHIALPLSRVPIIAQSYMKSFGPSAAPYWAQDAGRPIEPSKLRRCDRIDFVESAYETIDSHRSPEFRNTWGPQWLVRFCDLGVQPILELAIAANASIPPLGNDGSFPVGSYATVFTDRVLPPSDGKAATVEAAANSTSRGDGPISELPRLIGIGGGMSPTYVSYVITQQSSAGAISRKRIVGLSSSTLVMRPLPTESADVDTLFDFLSDNVSTTPVFIRRKAAAISKADLRAIFLRQP